MRRLTYIVSDLDRSLHFEWVAVALKSDYKLRFILLNQRPSALKTFLVQHDIPVLELIYTHKLSLVGCFIRVWWELMIHRTQVIHTHLWIANLVGLTAGWLLATPQRIFTRHHGTIHYDEFPSGRKWDLWCNARATQIVAISENVRTILTDRDGAPNAKITVVPHGFQLSYFRDITPDRLENLKQKYNLTANDYPVIGVIARYMNWKGIQYILPAFRKIKDKHPGAVLLLANASGPYKSEIQQVLKTWPGNWYREIEFEYDLMALYKVMNIYVHVPINPHAEAFGQTYVEALLAGVPSIFTLSGIAREFIRNEENALVVPFCDTDSIAGAIDQLVTSPELREQLIAGGYRSAEAFSFEAYLEKISRIYQR